MLWDCWLCNPYQLFYNFFSNIFVESNKFPPFQNNIGWVELLVANKHGFKIQQYFSKWWSRCYKWVSNHTSLINWHLGDYVLLGRKLEGFSLRMSYYYLPQTFPTKLIAQQVSKEKQEEETLLVFTKVLKSSSWLRDDMS